METTIDLGVLWSRIPSLTVRFLTSNECMPCFYPDNKSAYILKNKKQNRYVCVELFLMFLYNRKLIHYRRTYI